MDLEAGFWDLLLIWVVSLQVTLVAYLRDPRRKSLVLCLPFPFTVVALSRGKPIDAANVLGLLVFFLYVHGVRFFHYRLHLPIVAAIALSLAGYCLIGWMVVGFLPAGAAAFWTSSVAVFAVGLFFHLRSSFRFEPGHRTPLPVWLKLPIVAGVVCLLLLLKESLQGFATFFPMVSVVGAYEVRHSLWTLGRQVPVLMLALVPLMAAAYLTQGFFGLGGALAVGWGAFAGVLVPLMRRTRTGASVGRDGMS